MMSNPAYVVNDWCKVIHIGPIRLWTDMSREHLDWDWSYRKNGHMLKVKSHNVGGEPMNEWQLPIKLLISSCRWNISFNAALYQAIELNTVCYCREDTSPLAQLVQKLKVVCPWRLCGVVVIWWKYLQDSLSGFHFETGLLFSWCNILARINRLINNSVIMMSSWHHSVCAVIVN